MGYKEGNVVEDNSKVGMRFSGLSKFARILIANLISGSRRKALPGAVKISTVAPVLLQNYAYPGGICLFRCHVRKYSDFLEIGCCMGIHGHCLLSFQGILLCQAQTTNHAIPIDMACVSSVFTQRNRLECP